jgi:SAM-dependent methyltransferase
MFSPPDFSATENFLAPRLGPWTAALYSHRRPILDAVRVAAAVLTGRLLDVGCGNKPYAPLLRCTTHFGVDVPTSPHDHGRFDAVYDGRTLPFPDAAFDSILCTEVMEHAINPLGLAAEIGRVLRPGGHALVTAPYMIHTHESPHDYQRFTRYGMEQLARAGGLELVWVRPRGGVFVVAAIGVLTALSQVVGRRPLSDVMNWMMFPGVLLARLLDRWRGRPEVLTLGWQMLARKPHGEFS